MTYYSKPNRTSSKFIHKSFIILLVLFTLVSFFSCKKASFFPGSPTYYLPERVIITGEFKMFEKVFNSNITLESGKITMEISSLPGVVWSAENEGGRYIFKHKLGNTVSYISSSSPIAYLFSALLMSDDNIVSAEKEVYEGKSAVKIIYTKDGFSANVVYDNNNFLPIICEGEGFSFKFGSFEANP